MGRKVKKIDTGNSSFVKLITSDNLYVDKTSYLYRLVSKSGAYYCLSRPRRFGKSLTIGTLEEIFRGNRELFRGLYIDGTDYDWKEYPVIHIDFSKCQRDNPSSISYWMNSQIMKIASSYNVRLREEDGYDINLDNLIDELAKREKVVVLVTNMIRF